MRFSCDPTAAVSPGAASQATTIGYVTKFLGLGITDTNLPQQHIVFTPFDHTLTPNYTPAKSALAQDTDSQKSTFKLVGVLDSIGWEPATPGSPIKVVMYVPEAIWTQLKTVSETVLKDTSITGFEFWVASYDAKSKQWTENFYPLGKSKGYLLAGALNTSSGSTLKVSGEGTRLQGEDIAIEYYRVGFELVAIGDSPYSINFCVSGTANAVLPWGFNSGASK
jgi:hypothetical protein